jgi:hypothetical protein
MKKFLVLIAMLLMSVSAFAHPRHLCATVYQGYDYTGAELRLRDGVRVRDLNDVDMSRRADWDNRISSIIVEPGCTLYAYQYQNLGRDWDYGHRIGESRAYRAKGRRALYIDALRGMNDKISSLKCRCH